MKKSAKLSDKWIRKCTGARAAAGLRHGLGRARMATHRILGAGFVVLGLLLIWTPPVAWAQAETRGLPEKAVSEALALAIQAAQSLAPSAARVLATPGALDARLKLAPCDAFKVYQSAGMPAWGRTRVGVRCTQGPSGWNVFLPVTVQVWAPAATASQALPAGSTVEASHLVLAEVDWGAATDKPLALSQMAVGRVLARPVAAGQPLRSSDLLARKWFAPGDTVRVSAAGPGFSIDTEAQAISPGLEGQPVRVRTANGRVLVGRAVGDRHLEVGP